MVGEKSRRAFLVGSTIAIAGCSSNEVEDSDGDGVIDSEDYAPRDPDVQEKSDLVATETPAAGRAVNNTKTQTATPTPTPTPTSTPRSNSLRVTDSYWEGRSRILEYSLNQVTVDILDDLDSRFDDLRAIVEAQQYPRDGRVATGISDTFSTGSLPVTTSVEIESSLPENERLYYGLYLARGDKDVSELESDEIQYVFETDPFSIDSRKIEPDPHDDALGPDSADGFERGVVEGAYTIEISGTTMGSSWDASFYVFKSAVLDRSLASRGRSRPEYVTYEINEGFAREFANLLDGIAEDIGFTNKRDKVEFVIDLVQRLPYVPDDVSTGFDDYTKFMLETIARGEGDCEDTAIMLAATLQAQPFGYDMILIQPPGHMAAGIYDTDPQGYYWEYDDQKYSYIETTGEGWGVGDLPEVYQGSDATLYQV